ncbi:uncharacterized protein LOC144579699 [Callithrix jacchus]
MLRNDGKTVTVFEQTAICVCLPLVWCLPFGPAGSLPSLRPMQGLSSEWRRPVCLAYLLAKEDGATADAHQESAHPEMLDPAHPRMLLSRWLQRAKVLQKNQILSEQILWPVKPKRDAERFKSFGVRGPNPVEEQPCGVEVTPAHSARLALASTALQTLCLL